MAGIHSTLIVLSNVKWCLVRHTSHTIYRYHVLFCNWRASVTDILVE